MALTPMMQQYFKLKEAYKDTILLYRLGDFYEMFFDDAVLVSRELELTLTGRDCGLSERAPMCGVPYHAADTYIARLLEKGYKVAICEQTTKPGDQKGLVKREIVREITPGTRIDDGMLDEKTNNYIASVYLEDGAAGVSWADISTGEIAHRQIDIQIALGLNELLSRLSPSEIICNHEMLGESVNLSLVKFGEVCPFTAFDEAAFEYDAALAVIKETLPGYKMLLNKKHCVISAGALMAYLNTTQKRKINHLSRSQIENEDEYLVLDRNARQTLELTASQGDGRKRGSLLWCIDKTKTPMGARLLRQWIDKPLKNPTKIEQRLDAVAYFIENGRVLNGASETLKRMHDLSRLSARAAYGKLSPRDCRALGVSLRLGNELKRQLSDCQADLIRSFVENIDDFDSESRLLLSAIKEEPAAVVREGGVIADGFDAELDELRGIHHNAKTILKNLENLEKEQTGIKNLRISYNRVFGYYIEITKSQIAQVPYRYIRRQTLANCERYVTEELKEIENKIFNAEEMAKLRELTLYDEIVGRIKNRASQMIVAADSIAAIDCLACFAEVSVEGRFTRPIFTQKGGTLRIFEGRHVMVEKVIDDPFVPNDTFLDGDENRTMLITGPNMAGKSIYMRQVALIVILAHMGCFVPVKSAEIPPIDRIFTRVGASDDTLKGRSTFMVEMSEVSTILGEATDDSLLLMDEIGRGTATFDGLSIAWAIIEHITQKLKCKTLFSTHYHELTELEGVYDGVKNYKMTVRELNGSIIFMRKLLRGSANKSFGIEVAALSGLPKDVIKKAKEIYGKLEAVDIARAEKEDNNYKNQQISIFSDIGDSKKDEVFTILSELDLESVSPRDALDILYDLKEKVDA